MLQRFISRFCVEIFFVSVLKNFVGGTFLICVSEKFWYRKKIMDKRGGGERRREYHDFQSKILSHNSEKFRRGILLFLRNILVSKRFMHEKGGITFFRPKFLVSHCQKISWASLQCFRKIGVSKKIMHNRGYHVLPSKIFDLTVPKNFVSESYCFWENFWFRKVLVSQCRKKIVGIPSITQKTWGIEKFYA